MPVDFRDHVFVPFQTVDLAVVGEAEVEDADGLVRAAGREELVERGVEGEGVDGILVGVVEDDGGFVVARGAQVGELHGQVVGDGAEEVLAVHGVVLDVVDGCGVVCEGAGGRDGLVFE